MRMRRLEVVSLASPVGLLVYLQLSVTVLAVGGEVLADGNSLLDEHVKVLWDLGGKAYWLPVSFVPTEADLYSAADARGQSCCRLALQPGQVTIPLDLRIRRILLPVTTGSC
jgi:hypothetical protein